MLGNLTREIIYYSVIPVLIVLIIDLFLLLFKKKTAVGTFNFSTLIKISLIVMIAFVLPLITGYMAWSVELFVSKGILLDKILFVILLLVLTITLFVLMIWTYVKSLHYFEDEEICEENENA